MTGQERNYCRSCLGAGRKMIALNDIWLKQCFLQILTEIPIYEPGKHVPDWLCWECAALLRRFTQFKQQVAHSYNTLQNYEIQRMDIKLHRRPKLTIIKLNNIDYPETEIELELPDIQIINNEYNHTNQLTNEIKQETTKEVKSEIDSHSDFDNEDELLINYVQKKKKAAKKKKKMKSVEVYTEIELTESEIEQERREMELRDEYVNAMFRCERCIVSFPNADDLKDHIAVKHDLNSAHHKCPICTCSFVSEISYNYHVNKHRRRYACCACAVRLRSARAAQKHHDTAHGMGLNYEDQVNGDTEMANTNTNGVKSEAIFPCEQCAKTFRWKTSLRKHMETHRIEAGQKRKPYCEPCKLSFTTTSNLQKHVKTSSKHQIQLKLRKLKDTLPEDSTPEKQQAHIEEIKCSVNNSRQKHPCAHCGKRFQWRGNLLRHLTSHTARSEQKHPCAHCGKRFQWRKNLLRHLTSHAARANGELVCTPCNRTFSSVATYKQHMRLSRAHASEQDFPHVCAECGRRFANKTRLRDHIDWDHKRHFTHHCTQCQKVFKSHTSLYLHKQVVHKKDNAEHLCDHCGKPFPNHAKLRSHIIALHTSESPYKCTSCSARFSWHSCLSRHVRRVHKRK